MDPGNRVQEPRREVVGRINRNHKGGGQVTDAGTPEEATTTQGKTESDQTYGIHISVGKVDERS